MKTNNITKLKQLLLAGAFCALFSNNKAYSADYYWVGGSGDWSEYSTHWATTSGGSTFHTDVPTTSDDVYFDANSGGFGDLITANSLVIYCRNMDWTGSLSGITFSVNSTLSCYGSITLVSGMTLYHTDESIYFRGTDNSTLTSAGHHFDDVFVDTDGSLTLLDDFESNSIEIMDGSFNSNDQQITTDESFLLNYLNDDITVDLGSSTVYTYDWSIQGIPANTATVSFEDATIYLTNDAYRFEGDDRTYGKVVLFDLAGGFDFTGNNTINELEINGGNAVEFESGSTQSINTLTLNSSSGFSIVLGASSTASQATLDLGQAVCAEYLEISYLAVTGATATAGTGSVNNGNNSGWTFSGADCGVVSSLDQEQLFEVITYPMPVSDVLNIEYESSGKEWVLYNSLGSVLDSGTGKQINVESLPSGIYLLNIENQVVEIVKE